MRVIRGGGRIRAEAIITLDSHIFPSTGKPDALVYFDWPSNYLDITEVNADAFAIAALPFCVQTGERLLIEKPLTQILFLNLLEAAEIYHYYFPGTTHRFNFECTVKPRRDSPATGIGAFFLEV